VEISLGLVMTGREREEKRGEEGISLGLVMPVGGGEGRRGPL